MHWRLRDRVLEFGPRPLVMGIVNVTPDSFSDGGQFFQPERAVAHGLELVNQGADLLDIGGESTRPGSLPVEENEELRRVAPVVEALAAQTTVPLSVDTSKAVVAGACLKAGAHIVNDVTAFTGDANMLKIVRDAGAGVILMHMQGTPKTMQAAPHYDNVIEEICGYLQERLAFAMAGGLYAEQIALDPGIGFGKTYAHNMDLLSRLKEFQRLGRPICLGVSRKGFLGKITGPELGRRITASLAVACHAVMQSAVQILRVHDVQQTRDAVTILEALRAKEK
jgi:dihydropteroate synthase